MTETLEQRLKAVLEEAKASIHKEFSAVIDKMDEDFREERAVVEATQEKVERLVTEGYQQKIRALEAENERLREALSLSSTINPYGSIENAKARDMARSVLYQVPALPVNPEHDRIVEDLVAKHRKDEVRTPLKRK